MNISNIEVHKQVDNLLEFYNSKHFKTEHAFEYSIHNIENMKAFLPHADQ